MIILDTSAVTALTQGHRVLHLLADDVAHTPGDRLHVPALCLMQGEVASEGLAREALALPGVLVDPLDQAAAATIGGLVRDGWGGPDTCHALYPEPQRAPLPACRADGGGLYGGVGHSRREWILALNTGTDEGRGQ